MKNWVKCAGVGIFTVLGALEGAYGGGMDSVAMLASHYNMRNIRKAAIDDGREIKLLNKKETDKASPVSEFFLSGIGGYEKKSDGKGWNYSGHPHGLILGWRGHVSDEITVGGYSSWTASRINGNRDFEGWDLTLEPKDPLDEPAPSLYFGNFLAKVDHIYAHSKMRSQSVVGGTYVHWDHNRWQILVGGNIGYSWLDTKTYSEVKAQREVVDSSGKGWAETNNFLKSNYKNTLLGGGIYGDVRFKVFENEKVSFSIKAKLDGSYQSMSHNSENGSFESEEIKCNLVEGYAYCGDEGTVQIRKPRSSYFAISTWLGLQGIVSLDNIKTGLSLFGECGWQCECRQRYHEGKNNIKTEIKSNIVNVDEVSEYFYFSSDSEVSIPGVKPSKHFLDGKLGLQMRWTDQWTTVVGCNFAIGEKYYNVQGSAEIGYRF